jgi:hypothetical protein
MKTLDTKKKKVPLTTDLSEDKDLDDHKEMDGYSSEAERGHLLA